MAFYRFATATHPPAKNYFCSAVGNNTFLLYIYPTIVDALLMHALLNPSVDKVRNLKSIVVIKGMIWGRIYLSWSIFSLSVAILTRFIEEIFLRWRLRQWVIK